MPEPIDDMSRLLSVSRVAAKLVSAHPEWAAELHPPQRFAREAMLGALEPIPEDEDAFKRDLRQLRNRVLLRVMARDLDSSSNQGNRLASLQEVCETMTDLA